jgi:hypothetical protein
MTRLELMAMTSTKSWWKWAGVLVSSTALLAACTGDLGGSNLEGGSESGAGANSSGSGASSGDGGIDLSGGTGAGNGSGGACVGLSNEATFVGANAFIAIDKSGSMSSNNKWTDSRNAFTAFFVDPGADSLDVALRFWPDQGCDDSSGCNVNVCATPQVPLGSLSDPNHEQALINLFNSKSPGGLTPMSAALAGATTWAANYQTNGGEAGEVSVVILLSDGSPTSCDTNSNNIINIAANAFNNDSVLTFAVGLQGSNETLMHQIAAAGGTQMAYIIGSGNAEQQLLAALQAIQQTVLACSFAMPESPDPNMPIDPNQVNITYTPGDGSGTQTIPKVATEQDCGSAGGWYYDDNNNPSVINLCPDSCTAVQSDMNGTLEVEIGCATVVQ